MDAQVNIQHQQPFMMAQAGVGMVVIPPTPNAPPSSASDSTTMTVRSRGSSIAEARISALGEAARQASNRGITGVPHIRAESFQDGAYNAIVEFAASAHAPATPQAMSPDNPQPPPVIAKSAPEPSRPSSLDAGPGRPSWIMVVAFESGGPGPAVWGRASAWSRAWAAPIRKQGLRLVSVMGDADDRDRLTLAMLADPSSPKSSEAALGLGRKYGAPAVAMLRREPTGGVTILLLRQGGAQATRTVQGVGADEIRESTIAAISSLLSEIGPSAGPSSGTFVDLQQEGDERPGSFGFSLVVESQDKAAIGTIRRSVIDMSGVSVQRSVTDEDGLEIVGYWAGDRASFEKSLAMAGVKISTK